MASGVDEGDDVDLDDIYSGGDVDPTKSLTLPLFHRRREKDKGKRQTFHDFSGEEERRKDSSSEEQRRSRSESLDLEDLEDLEEEEKEEAGEEEEEEEDEYGDEGSEGVEYGGMAGYSLEDSVGDYVDGLPGTTPPKQFLIREKRKDKLRASGGSGKSLSHHEARLAHRKNAESKKNHIPGRASDKGASKKELRKQQGRSGTPPQLQVLSEESKSSKKKQKIQRKKDHDDKKDFLQPNPMDISRSLSEDIASSSSAVNALDFAELDVTAFLRRRGSNLSEEAISNGMSVTESLNPSHLRRDSGTLSAGSRVPSRGRVRRTNSDAQFFPSDMVPTERRCPHERKQFYRQFTKNLKLYGIRSAANRMEQSGNHGTLKYHSQSVIFTSGMPVNPKVEKLWAEIRSKLKSCEYEQWLFFKHPEVDAVLRKVVHFCFTGLGAEDVPLQNTRNNEEFHGSVSSPALHSRSKVGQRQSGETKERGKLLPTSKLLQVRRQSSLDESCIEEAATNFAASSAAEIEAAEPSNNLLTSSVVSSLGGSPEETSRCKVHHREYLSLLQRKALSSVTELLNELEEVESYYMNRRKMGDKHHVYCTLHFKRRVCALILWQKVTFGLAESLCRLSNWLGTEILLPDVCKDPPPQLLPSPMVDSSVPLSLAAGAAPGQVTTFSNASSSIRNSLAETKGKVGEDLSTSPLVQAQFSIGPVEEGEEDEENEDEMMSAEEYPSGSLYSYGGTTVLNTSFSSSHSDATTVQPRRIVHQASVLEPYRDFVSRSLKRTGLSKTTKRLKEFMKSVITIAKYAMSSLSEEDSRFIYQSDDSSDQQKPLLQSYMDPKLLRRLDENTHEIPPGLFERSMSIDSQDWMQVFKSMELPAFTVQYIQLMHVPLDVMQECLQLQSELGKELSDPSSHSVKQLADECREILEHAIDVRDFYRENMKVVLKAQPQKAEQVEADMEAFETDMKNVLKIYFQYLTQWVTLSSGHVLEEEWRKVKTICTSIRGGEAEAGRNFCDMVTQLLSGMGDDLETKMDDCCSCINRSHTSIDTDMEPKDQLMKSCREFKELFVGLRENVNRVLGFAKILRKDLEIAADFTVSASVPDLLSVLKSSDHVRVVLSHQRLDKMIFVPESIVDEESKFSEVQQLLKVSFAHGSSQDSGSFSVKDSYLLLLRVDVLASQSGWTGKTVRVQASVETTINLLELQVDSLKMVVSNSAQLADCRNSFMRAVNKSVVLCNERTSSHENVADRINGLKRGACELAIHLMKTAGKVMQYLDIDNVSTADDHISSYRSTMHSCFNLGFEYVREVFRLLGDDMAYRELGDQALEFTLTWIQQFVLPKCERGRGTRPRWAGLGLEFVVLACAPTMLASISQSKFENVKKFMNRCVDHVVGEAPPTTASLIDLEMKSRKVNQQNLFNKPPKLLDHYALGHSYTGISTLRGYDDEDEDTGSMFQLPDFGGGRKPSKHPAARRRIFNPRDAPLDPISQDPIGSLEPVAVPFPDMSPYLPSRLPRIVDKASTAITSTAEHDGMGGAARGKEATDGISGGRDSSKGYHVSFRPQSSSPPTSTESLGDKDGYSSSGVDSSPAPSFSDIACTPGDQTTKQKSGTATSTPIPVTPTSQMSRMDSVLSSASSTASHYYSQLSYLAHQSSSSSGEGNATPKLPHGCDNRNASQACNAPPPMDNISRIRQSIQLMEEKRQLRLIATSQVGRVQERRQSISDKGAKLKKLRQTNFKWQLGRKLGQGSFGKVYECINRTTGETNAVKQVSLLDKDSKDIETIIDEIENFQKLRSDYIVKFYGAEVHHNELYMFMEYCNEGTLWTIAQQGLHEEMIRRYTRDILKAVDAMHTRDMVHRDIKGANIFLSSNGSIKLGDFGLSVQLQNFKNTNAKEIEKIAGTIQYMSPEIILKNKCGKSVDIWAVGCVLIEMVTGKLPWSEYKESLAIMYKLGVGERPSIPTTAKLSKEGHNFLDKCLTFDACARPTAIDLSSHPFVKVSD